MPHPATGIAPGFFSNRSITDVGEDLRRGYITSRALVEQALDGIAHLNPILNCFVSVDREGALAAAASADVELTQGLDRGPLHGIPTAIKDIIDVAGEITTSGSALFVKRRATSDATCVARLRAAGAIFVGKTVLHEFAYGITGDRSFHGASRNPHDPTRISGGSSGGSAVAVAAGLVPLALGTDTAGSVRVPAALCGVVGYKPAFDAIPSEGVHPLAPSLDHVGLFARTSHDVRLAYEVLVDQSLIAEPISKDVGVGWVDPSSFGPVNPTIAHGALSLLTHAGIEPKPLAFQEYGDFFELFSTIQSSEAYLAHVSELQGESPPIDSEVLARLKRGAEVPAWRYLQATEARRELCLRACTLLKVFDVLAMPTVPMTAPPIGERSPMIAGAVVETRRALLSLTCLWNLTGLPALTIPAGSIDGLPFGLQLIVAPGREGALFDFAHRIEFSTMIAPASQSSN